MRLGHRFSPVLLAASLALPLGCSSGGTSGGGADECSALSQCCGGLEASEQEPCNQGWQQANTSTDRIAQCSALLDSYVALGDCAPFNAGTGGSGGGLGGSAGTAGASGGVGGIGGGTGGIGATAGTSTGGAGGSTGGAGGSTGATGGVGGSTGGAGGSTGGAGGSTGATGGVGGSTGGTGGSTGGTGGSTGGTGGSTGGTGGTGGSTGGTGGTGGTTSAKLYFSEYIEGSSNNKALEIFNAGTASVDLSTCGLMRYSNGGTTGYSISLATAGGSLAANDVWVICHSLFVTASYCDELTSSINHNGNDTYELVCNGVTQDVFGQVGVDPGTAWVSGSVSTIDQTLRRKCTVSTGDKNGTDAFDPALQWSTYAIDTLSGLGSHCAN